MVALLQVREWDTTQGENVCVMSALCLIAKRKQREGYREKQETGCPLESIPSNHNLPLVLKFLEPLKIPSPAGDLALTP